MRDPKQTEIKRAISFFTSQVRKGIDPASAHRQMIGSYGLMIADMAMIGMRTGMREASKKNRESRYPAYASEERRPTCARSLQA